ncbi:uncharacterized protein LOC129224550 [Uloborus diversus]|uniref:uncharacterized protein LOC129224550 n=1 Tax=Uloborus diversus TaxID=327109 RepID=UPI0024091FD6|nr:uncharacterized protein LOC129224550 [Uloborus diversus]
MTIKFNMKALQVLWHLMILATTPFNNTEENLNVTSSGIERPLSSDVPDASTFEPNDVAEGCREMSLHKCGSNVVRVFQLLDYLPLGKSFDAKCALRKEFFKCMEAEETPCKKRVWRLGDSNFRRRLLRSLWSTRGCVLRLLPNGTHV